MLYINIKNTLSGAVTSPVLLSLRTTALEMSSDNNIELKIKNISQSMAVDLNLVWNLLLCRGLLKKKKNLSLRPT